MGDCRWTERDLQERPKSDPAKLALAARVREETTLTISWPADGCTWGVGRASIPNSIAGGKPMGKAPMKPDSCLAPKRR